jgi:hypothetical protein
VRDCAKILSSTFSINLMEITNDIPSKVQRKRAQYNYVGSCNGSGWRIWTIPIYRHLRQYKYEHWNNECPNKSSSHSRKDVYHPAFFLLLWIPKEAIVGLLSQLCYECLQKAWTNFPKSSCNKFNNSYPNVSA